MFKIAENVTYKWPVTVAIPQDGGKFVKATFSAEFKGLTQPEIDAIIQASRNGDTDADICVSCLVGWSGVKDSDDQDLPYSDAAKERLLAIPYVRNGVVNAFFESISGGAARRKN